MRDVEETLRATGEGGDSSGLPPLGAWKVAAGRFLSRGRGLCLGLGAVIGCVGISSALLWPAFALGVGVTLIALLAAIAVATLIILVKSDRSGERLPGVSLDGEPSFAAMLKPALIRAGNAVEGEAYRGFIDFVAIDSQLTPREREVCALLLKGRDVKHISEELVVSVNTVRTHVQNVYSKFGVHSRQELIDRIEVFAREYEAAEDVSRFRQLC